MSLIEKHDFIKIQYFIKIPSLKYFDNRVKYIRFLKHAFVLHVFLFPLSKQYLNNFTKNVQIDTIHNYLFHIHLLN